MKLFLTMAHECDGYQPKCITPYMHIMAFHMPKCIEKFGSLWKFSCQGIHSYLHSYDTIIIQED